MQHAQRFEQGRLVGQGDERDPHQDAEQDDGGNVGIGEGMERVGGDEKIHEVDFRRRLDLTGAEKGGRGPGRKGKRYQHDDDDDDRRGQEENDAAHLGIGLDLRQAHPSDACDQRQRNVGDDRNLQELDEKAADNLHPGHLLTEKKPADQPQNEADNDLDGQAHPLARLDFLKLTTRVFSRGG